jgi:hypothetical protein
MLSKSAAKGHTVMNVTSSIILQTKILYERSVGTIGLSPVVNKFFKSFDLAADRVLMGESQIEAFVDCWLRDKLSWKSSRKTLHWCRTHHFTSKSWKLVQPFLLGAEPRDIEIRKSHLLSAYHYGVLIVTKFSEVGFLQNKIKRITFGDGVSFRVSALWSLLYFFWFQS